MQYETWDKMITVQGKSVTVHAVSGNRCPECGEAVFDPGSYDRVVAASDGLVRGKRGTDHVFRPLKPAKQIT